MARGDCISGLVSVANAATVTIQPAAGVQWLIETFFSSVYFTGVANARILPGTIILRTAARRTALSQRYTANNSIGPLIIDNILYLQFTDAGGGAGETLGYSGVQYNG